MEAERDLATISLTISLSWTTIYTYHTRSNAPSPSVAILKKIHIFS